MLVEITIYNDILYLPKQCHDAHVDKWAFQNRLT